MQSKFNSLKICWWSSGSRRRKSCVRVLSSHQWFRLKCRTSIQLGAINVTITLFDCVISLLEWQSKLIMRVGTAHNWRCHASLTHTGNKVIRVRSSLSFKCCWKGRHTHQIYHASFNHLFCSIQHQLQPSSTRLATSVPRKRIHDVRDKNFKPENVSSSVWSLLLSLLTSWLQLSVSFDVRLSIDTCPSVHALA